MKDDAPTPSALLDQALQGDPEALGRLLEAQRAGLHRVAERQLEGPIAVRVDASDVLQQTFLEAYRSFPQFAGRNMRELAAWLRTILDHKVAGAIRDHALLQKRDVGRERSMDDSHRGGAPLKHDLDGNVTSPSQKVIRGEQTERLSEALAALPDDQREAVRLRHVEGLALADIARRLGRTPAATAGLIKRGMKALRRRLHGNESR
jgi:RNA polymerase sigma-70 factor, ECF subfamily